MIGGKSRKNRSSTVPPRWAWLAELLIVIYYVVEPVSAQLHQ